MAKLNSKFICQQCSFESPRWFGKCPECGSWNTAVETVVERKSNTSRTSIKSRTGVSVAPVKLTEITNTQTERVITRISELDRVLGGGIVPGQVTLIAGEPGIGKSTLLLQVADQLSNSSLNHPEFSSGSKTLKRVQNDNKLQHNGGSVLYVSGEESVRQ